MRLKFLPIIFITLMGLVFFYSVPKLHASNADCIQAKIDEQNKEIAKFETEIASYKNELDKITSDKETLSSTIKELDITQKKLEADINVTLGKITQTTLKIEQLGLEINGKKSNIDNLEFAIEKSMREISENDRRTFTEYFFSGQPISYLWHHLSTIESLQKNMSSNIKDLGVAKTDLEGKKTTTESEKSKLI